MRLHASTCRRIAREVLSGQWLAAVFTGFTASVLGVFTNLITGVLKLMIIALILLEFCEAIPHYTLLILLVIFLIALLWTFFGPYVRVGYLEYNLSLLDQRSHSGPVLFGTSSSWWDCFYVYLRVTLRAVIGGIFFIIPGLISYYTYAMAPFLMEERTNLSVSDALGMSRELMKGHRFEFFCLRLSFLGWRILGFLTLGIAFLWINPYYFLSETVFFNEVSGRAEALYDRRNSRGVKHYSDHIPFDDTFGDPFDENYNDTAGGPFDENYNDTAGGPFDENYNDTAGGPFDENYNDTAGDLFDESFNDTFDDTF